jgi:hypothetical protein
LRLSSKIEARPTHGTVSPSFVIIEIAERFSKYAKASIARYLSVSLPKIALSIHICLHQSWHQMLFWHTTVHSMSTAEAIRFNNGSSTSRSKPQLALPSISGELHIERFHHPNSSVEESLKFNTWIVEDSKFVLRPSNEHSSMFSIGHG